MTELDIVDADRITDLIPDGQSRIPEASLTVILPPEMTDAEKDIAVYDLYRRAPEGDWWDWFANIETAIRRRNIKRLKVELLLGLENGFG